MATLIITLEPPKQTGCQHVRCVFDVGGKKIERAYYVPELRNASLDLDTIEPYLKWLIAKRISEAVAADKTFQDVAQELSAVRVEV